MTRHAISPRFAIRTFFNGEGILFRDMILESSEDIKAAAVGGTQALHKVSSVGLFASTKMQPLFLLWKILSPSFANLEDVRNEKKVVPSSS